MKKPIDPNLGDALENELLSGGAESIKKEEFGFNDYSSPAPEPVFTVKDKETGEPIDIDAKAKPAVIDPDDDTHHHHHHHHHSSDGSSGSSHHSSSGPHSSSSSSHRSSSGSHSSSSSSHHSSSGSHRSSSSSHHSSGSSHHSSSSSHRSSGSSHHSSSSSHRHSSKKKKKKLPLPARVAIGFLIVIFIFVVVGLGTFLALMINGSNDLKSKGGNTEYQETIEYNGHTYKYNDNVFAIAFMGIDQRDMKTSEETSFVGAADADIVLSIDSKTGTTKAIAIPRDTMIDIDLYTNSGVFLRNQTAQLCLAYAYGDGSTKSCQYTVDAMSRILLNVPISKYFALDLNGIKPLNDAIGGVTVQSLYDFPDMGVKKGETVTLKGDMAETYVRERSMDEIDAALKRSDRQVQYVKAYAAQVIPSAMQDFSIVTSLYNTATGYSQTNISLSNVTYAGTLLLSRGVTDFQTRTLKGEMKASDDPVLEGVVHAEFYPDQNDLTEAVLDAFYTQVD